MAWKSLDGTQQLTETVLCTNCHERPAAQSLRWYAFVPAFFCDGFSVFERYCAKCAGFRNELSVLAWVALGLVTFFIAVIAL